ncbi:MAG: putative Ig domain-containing protein, partial [Pseudomonadales bacterium]
DGVEVLNQNTPLAFPSNSDDFIIGADTGNQFIFDGLIDEVRLWSVVRTQQQIQDSMHLWFGNWVFSGFPLSQLVSGRIAFWSFDETPRDTFFSIGSPTATGTTIFDSARPFGPDFDNDGIPSDAEVSVGLDHENAADALLDLDGDTFPNIDEYRAGSGIDDINDTPDDYAITQYKLFAAGGDAQDNLGADSSAISGNTIVYSATGADIAARDAGAAYVFQQSGSDWTEQAVLTASDAAAGDAFGVAAIDGDTVIVGATGVDCAAGADCGAAYVFARAGSVWTELVKLTAPDEIAFAQFGRSVAIDGDWLFVGADDSRSGVNQGSVYAYQRISGNWNYHSKLVASDDTGNTNRSFGISLSVDGVDLVVGDWFADSVVAATGAAYVFQLNAGTWVEQAKLVSDAPNLNDYFGFSVSIKGDLIAVGAYGDDDGANNYGAVYIFERAGSSWSQIERLSSTDPNLEEIGRSVAISGKWLVAHARCNSGVCPAGISSTGVALLYLRTAGTWQLQIVGANDGNIGDTFAETVALDGDTVALGSFGNDIGAVNNGAGYVLDLNRDNDSLGTLFELAYGLDPFAAGDETLDNDDDGLDNLGEQQLGTSPLLADTDGDLFSDKTESDQGSDPLDPNSSPLNQVLLFSQQGNSDSIGYQISMDGNTALAGSGGGRVSGVVGAAYVFTRDASQWQEQALLQATVPQNGNSFGIAVSLDGDTAVIGAEGSNKAHVFVRSGTVWSEQQVLTGSDSVSGDRFGSAVAVSGDTLIVGARQKDSGALYSGAAYIFTRSGGVWTEQAKLTPSTPNYTSYFGAAVALEGTTAVVGAPGDEQGGQDSGSIYVFTGSGAVWSEQANILKNASMGFCANLGASVSLQGDRLVGGAPGGFCHSGSGSIGIYERSGSVWSEQAILFPTDGQGEDKFGISVGLEGDAIVVGASESDASDFNAGAAYLFHLEPTGWTEQTRLLPDDAQLGDNFGFGAAIEGDAILVGAIGADQNGAESGKVYSLYNDFDYDGVPASSDNCQRVANPPQGNTDGDARGNICDLDDDLSPDPDFGFLDLVPPNPSALPGVQFDFTPTVGYSGPSALCFTASNLPAWANFDARDGRIAGTPSNDDFGSSSVSITATEVLFEPAAMASECASIAVPGGQSLASQPFSIDVQDTRAPTVFASPNGGSFNSSSVDVSLTCVESLGAGCATIYYEIDAVATTSSTALPVASPDYAATIQLTSGGTLHFIAEDAAGNVSSESTAAFSIDGTAPSVVLSSPINGELVGTGPLVSGGASDTGSSGFDRVDIQITGDDGKGLNSSGNNVVAGSNEIFTLCTTSCASFSLDTSSFAYTDNALYTVTVTAYDNAGNSAQDSLQFEYYGGQPQFTTLDLNLSSNSVLFNGEVDIALNLSVPGNPSADLAGEQVDVTITPPAGSANPPTLLSLAVNSAGQVTQVGVGDGVVAGGLLFDEKGTWTVEASYVGTIRYSASGSSAEALLVGTSAGYAVLIQGKAPTSEGLDSHNKTLNRVYDTLKRRNFADQNIFYFNYDPGQDVDGDGIPDNVFQDGKGIDFDPDLVGKAGIQNQVQNLYFAMNANPAPLYIVMVDHGNTSGSSSEFLLDNALDGSVSITPTELDSWLDVLESNLNAQAALEPRIVINGSCYSGGFIEALTGINGTALATPRVVITSSAANEVSYKGPLE